MKGQATCSALTALIMTMWFSTGCVVEPVPSQPPATHPGAVGLGLNLPATASPIPPTATAAPGEPPSEPDGPVGTVIFQRPGLGSIEAIDLVSGAYTILADPTDPGQRLPWSLAPDGRTLAVVTGHGWSKAGQATGNVSAALWVVQSDGSDPRKLLDLGANGLLQLPLGASVALTNDTFQTLPWLERTGEIVVASAHEGSVDLYAVAPDTGVVRRLTASPELEFQATLSADGALVLFGSAASFGTGAGWSQSGVGLVSSAGAEHEWLLRPDEVSDSGASLHVAGRVGDVLLVIVIEPGGVASILYALKPGEAARSLFRVQGPLTWAVGPDKVAVASRDAREQTVAVWVAGQPEAQVITSAARVQYLAWSPDGSALLICVGDQRNPLRRSLWSDGREFPLPDGFCTTHAWSPAGRLALGGRLDDQSEPGVVVAADGSVLRVLSPEAIPVGWSGGDLIAFVPDTQSGTTWQLFSFDPRRPEEPGRVIGPLLEGAPERALLVSVTGLNATDGALAEA